LNNSVIDESELIEFHKKIGKNVKKIRELKKVSQMKLAHEIGHDSVGHIAKAELHLYGKKFNLDHLYKMSKVLNVDIKDFFDT